jgi:hypothetical protein
MWRGGETDWRRFEMAQVLLPALILLDLSMPVKWHRGGLCVKAAHAHGTHIVFCPLRLADVPHSSRTPAPSVVHCEIR